MLSRENWNLRWNPALRFNLNLLSEVNIILKGGDGRRGTHFPSRRAVLGAK